MAEHTKSGQRSVDALHFAGERHEPLRPDEAARRRPTLGTGERPPELEALARSRSIFVRSDTEPKVEVSRAEPEGERDLWRVDIPIERAQAAGAILGQTSIRRKPEEFLAEIDPDVDYRGYKPEWMDALPVPRVLPQPAASPMVRLDGRRFVRPFQTTRFLPEERQVFQDASYPWGTVAKVFTNTRPGGAGTGVLIGPRLVATASHVVPRTSPWWMRIVPAYFDGSSLHGSGVQSFVSDTRSFDTGGDVVCGYDWAILRLYEPLGASLGFMGINGYDDDWENKPLFSVVGYPRAINSQRPSFQTGVSVFDDDSDSNGGMELETRADMGPGNSGGPMFARWGTDHRAVGVVSGEEYDDALGGGEWGNVVAGGAGFGNLVRWGRTNWP